MEWLSAFGYSTFLYPIWDSFGRVYLFPKWCLPWYMLDSSCLSFILFNHRRKHRSNMQGSVQQGQLNERTSAVSILSDTEKQCTQRCAFSLPLWRATFHVELLSLWRTFRVVTHQSILSYVWQFLLCYLIRHQLNPFFYCWRIRGVRKAVKDITRCPCFLST